MSLQSLANFAQRANITVVGRQKLSQMKKKLLFVLISCDISDNSRKEIKEKLDNCRIIEALTSKELEELFGYKGTKVIGFKRSDLSISIMKELEQAADS